MEAKIQKWGNSLALRIPKLLALDAHIARGSIVDVAVKKGKIIIVPAEKREISLEALVSGISPENVHGEIETGPPVGRETW